MANITIDLDGNAEERIAELEGELKQTKEQVAGLTAESAKLNEVQRQQIIVVQKQSSDWKTFTTQMTTATVPALSQVADKALDVGLEFGRMSHAGTEFALNAGMKVVNTLAEMASASLRYTLITKGAVDVIHATRGATKDATDANEEHGRSLLATAAKASALGVVVTTLTGKWESVGQAAAAVGGTTAKHIGGLIPLTAGATAGLAAFEALMARTGKRADDLGNITTNLDRIHAAAGGLAGDLQKPLVIVVDQAKELVTNMVQLPKVWREIDAAATRSADQLVININLLRDYVIGMRDLEEAEARREKRQKQEAPGYEALRRVNAELEAQDKSRARQAEITSITTVAGVEAEIAKVRERAREMVQAGKDASEIERITLAELQDLRRRRLAIETEQDTALRKLQQGYYDFRAASERQIEQDRRDADRKRMDETEAAFKRLREIREEEAQYETKLEEENERSRQIMREQAAADKQKKLAADEQARVAAAQREVDLEQKKQAALKNARQQALEKAGVNGQDLLQMARPQDVLNTLRQQAGEKARQQAAADNQDLLRKGQFDSNSPERRQYEMALQRAQQDAMRQATRDFQRGTTDPQAQAQAQAQAAQKQLGALQQQGKLSADSVQAMSELIQATAEQQATTQALQRQMAEYGRAAAALRGQAQQQRRQAQAGSLQ